MTWIWGNFKPISTIEDTVLAKFQFLGHDGNRKFRTFYSFLTGSCVNTLKKEEVERRNGLRATEFAFGLDRSLGKISILRGPCSLSVNSQEPLLKHGFTVETRKYTEKSFLSLPFRNFYCLLDFCWHRVYVTSYFPMSSSIKQVCNDLHPLWIYFQANQIRNIFFLLTSRKYF